MVSVHEWLHGTDCGSFFYGVFEVSTLHPIHALQPVLQRAASRLLSCTFYSVAVPNLRWFCLAGDWADGVSLGFDCFPVGSVPSAVDVSFRRGQLCFG